jgi:excinuclease ABC subunit C
MPKKSASDPIKKIRARLVKVPKKPGVYRWLNKKGDVLYVGKAKSLRDRMRSYMNEEKEKNPWKRSLRERIADFDMTLTQSELEALILETNLIKELRPKYNVLMKDDKNYVYVYVTDEEYPQIVTVRQILAVPRECRASLRGPFVSARKLKETLDMLHDVFRWRACKKAVSGRLLRASPVAGERLAASTPCLSYQIGQCNGLCIGRISKEEYQERIEKVMRFLKGDHKEVIKHLEELMQQAAKEKKFERAAKLRNILERLRNEEAQVVSDTSRENADIIGLAIHGDRAQVVLLRERNGRVIEELSYILVGKFDSSVFALTQFIQQYYSDCPDIPNVILVGEDIEDVDVIVEWLSRSSDSTIAAGSRRFSNRCYGGVSICIPSRGKKAKLLKMATFNAQQKVEQQYSKWEAEEKNIKSALRELKNVLGLSRIPSRIECYDISHLGGTETVGSMVVFKSGKSATDEYRSFTIRTLKEGEIDDYAALKEVLQRRLKYLSDETYREQYDGKKKKPDDSLMSKPSLLVIDGGKGQLSTATSVLQALQLDLPVIALAKRVEDVFVPDEPLPVAFKKDSQALFLLMRLRDEAHRRAHSHHEKRHTKSTIPKS